MLESGFVEFKLDWAASKTLAIGDVLLSDEFPAGGHVWRAGCFPRGSKLADSDGLHVSVGLQLASESKNVKAIFDAFVVHSDGTPSSSHAQHSAVHVYPPPEGFNKSYGFGRFVKRRDLDSPEYVRDDGHVTFMFGVIVLPGGDDGPIAVPPSDIGDHLGRLLDGGDGSDVSFVVGGEEFRAHRAVLAARSPVFKAQLLGAMADASTDRITLHGVRPETFRILLRFIYTDALPPGDDEEHFKGSSSSSTAIELLQDLLAAADMYHLDRLKLVCARKLCERVSAENVSAMLGCADMHGCPELKKRCIDFFVVEKNFRSAVLTEVHAADAELPVSD